MASNRQSEEQISARDINITDYTKCRSLELDAMMKMVSQSFVGGNRSVMQLLPRHMRRRAANHDVRRLPLKRRQEAQKELEACPPAKRKTPSRRHRRRPGNLLSEYARRKRRHVWLETHIWHAKRFHMTECWGYKIPNYPNDRGVRAAYRDAAKRCVLMDLSYYCCIEVCGPEQILTESLSKLTSPEIGPSFSAKYYIDGTREGHTILYAVNAYPCSALGEVSFLWLPRGHDMSASEDRQIWIWTHPASHDGIMDELKTVFSLTESNCQTVPVVLNTKSLCFDSDKPRPNGCIKEREENCGEKMEIEKTASDGLTSSKNEETDENTKKGPVKTKLKHSTKKDKVGHIGDAHLTKTDLVKSVYYNGVIRLESLKDELCRLRLIGPLAHRIVCSAMTPAPEPSAGDQVGEQFRWWVKYCATENGKLELAEQAESWKQMSLLQDAGELLPHCVHGLVVRDPRLFLPKTKSPATPCQSGNTDSAVKGTSNPAVSASPIWRKEVRDDVKLTKMSTHCLNQHRSQCLIPGSIPDLGSEESRIPVLLVQRPGINSDSCPDVCHGAGSGWDLILPPGWATEFWISLIYRGAKAAGLHELRSLAFETGHLVFPDNCPDTPAGAEMNSSRASVLRDAYFRRPPAKRCNYVKFGAFAPFHCPWQQLVSGWSGRVGDGFYCLRSHSLLKLLNRHCLAASESPLTDTSRLRDESCLVAVRVVMIGRGAPSQFASISLCSAIDLSSTDQQKHVHGSVDGPLEPRHVSQHQTVITDTGERSLSAEQVVDGCSRRTIGYVVEGGFSHAVGRGCGVGFVTARGLLTLLEQKPSLSQKATVLVRNTNSLQYRLATLTVIL